MKIMKPAKVTVTTKTTKLDNCLKFIFAILAIETGIHDPRHLSSSNWKLLAAMRPQRLTMPNRFYPACLMDNDNERRFRPNYYHGVSLVTHMGDETCRPMSLI